MSLENRTIWIISWIIGAVFVAILISLTAADKLSVGFMFVWITLTLFIVFIVDLSFYFIRKQKTISIEQEGIKVKVINLETAREMANKIIMSTQFSEYERESWDNTVYNCGDSRTPIYHKTIIGEFDGNVISILINMENKERISSKEYYLSEMNKEQIYADIDKRANKLASVPAAMPSSEDEVVEKPSGERVYRKRQLTRETVPQEKKGDLT